MSEQKFKKYIKYNIENMWGSKSHISFVESPDTSAGFPDCDLCVGGVEARVETKFSRDNKCFKLRPTQIAWFRRRNKAGAHNNFILWCQETNNTRYFHIIPGHKVKGLGKRSYAQDRQAVEVTWENKIDWSEFFEYLASTTK